VAALGGPLSYVFDHRDRALPECRRVVKRNGVLVVSAISMWGTSHRYLDQVLALGAEVNREVTRTGDLSSRTVPGSTHHCHMFRAGELRDLLERGGFIDLWLSAVRRVSPHKRPSSRSSSTRACALSTCQPHASARSSAPRISPALPWAMSQNRRGSRPWRRPPSARLSTMLLAARST
jgi:hypothetical protein